VSQKRREKTVVTAVSPTHRPQSNQVDKACLVMIYGTDLGSKYDIDTTSVTIGRSSKCELQIDEDAISRRHCRIEDRGNDGLVLEDLDSTNGTYLNDRPVTKAALREGDILKIGRTIFKFITGSNIERAYHEEIYKLTTIDGLTQVHNKRYFLESLERELSRARRHHRNLSMIMLDIDFFKQVNDSFGHVAGDFVLKELATVIQARIRREDVMSRYGGEEFAVLLPELALRQAVQFARKVNALVRETSFNFEGIEISVTVSIGVATLEPETDTASDLVKAADQWLYEAKRTGRDRVCCPAESTL
jgi:two-component system cell cycle response regulator